MCIFVLIFNNKDKIMTDFYLHPLWPKYLYILFTYHNLGQATSQQKRRQHVSVLLNTLLLDLLFKLLLAARKEYFVFYLFLLCFFVVVCIFDCTYLLL